MRILFCDDDPFIIEQLRRYVQEFFVQTGGCSPSFASYTNGDELLQNEEQADIAFLDVEMPGVSGIQVGAKLKERNPYIKIFIVTSYPDYLDEAMRFQVFRYLSKPIDKDRLFRNLKDAVYQYHLQTHKYPIETSNGVVVCFAEEIVCVEANQRKVLIHTMDQVIPSVENMEFWKTMLTLPCFYFAHRSYIVNMRYVTAVSKDSITLKYGEKTKEVFLARRRYTNFKDTFLLYLESVK